MSIPNLINELFPNPDLALCSVLSDCLPVQILEIQIWLLFVHNQPDKDQGGCVCRNVYFSHSSRGAVNNRKPFITLYLQTFIEVTFLKARLFTVLLKKQFKSNT